MAINDVTNTKVKDNGASSGNSLERFDPYESGTYVGKISKTKLLIILGIILSVALAITLVYYTKHKTKLLEEAKQEEMQALAKNNPIFTDLDEMIVNLDTRGKGINFLKLKLTLEVQDQQSLAALNRMMPKVKDAFQLYLRELRPSDLYGSISLYRLRDELLIRVNKILYPAKINDILFKDVLVQ